MLAAVPLLRWRAESASDDLRRALAPFVTRQLRRVVIDAAPQRAVARAAMSERDDTSESASDDDDSGYYDARHYAYWYAADLAPRLRRAVYY